MSVFCFIITSTKTKHTINFSISLGFTCGCTATSPRKWFFGANVLSATIFPPFAHILQ